MNAHLTKFAAIAISACLALASCGPNGAAEQQADASAAALPTNIGDCAETTVTLVGTRLEGVADSGSGIVYANGLTQVDYAAVPGIDHSTIGDAVRVCLVSIPENCPPGDDRGRFYAATNLRTNETWTLPDSQHMCGGA
jgi:hypothetical protein